MMTNRRLAAAVAAFLMVSASTPAVAQADLTTSGMPETTFGDLLVLDSQSPGICRALAAGLAERATEVFAPDRDPAAAARAFADAPTAFADLKCSETGLKELLDCIVSRSATLRRDLLNKAISVEQARGQHRERALACVQDQGY